MQSMCVMLLILMMTMMLLTYSCECPGLNSLIALIDSTKADRIDSLRCEVIQSLKLMIDELIPYGHSHDQ